MTKCPSILELVNAGREEEAVSLLKEGVHLVGAIGPRSAKVALEASKKLCIGDLMGAIEFMNYRHP